MDSRHYSQINVQSEILIPFALTIRKIYIWFSVFVHLSFVRSVSFRSVLYIYLFVLFFQYVCWFAYFHSIYFHFMYLFVSLTLIPAIESVLFWNCDLFFLFLSFFFRSFFIFFSFTHSQLSSTLSISLFLRELFTLPIYFFLSSPCDFNFD